MYGKTDYKYWMVCQARNIESRRRSLIIESVALILVCIVLMVAV